MSDTPPQPLEICPACGCRDLFIRKDFPQKIGLAIVAIAGISFLILAANPHTFYVGVWVLVIATVVDAIMYVIVPKITVCYKCRAEFGEMPINPKHEGYELAIGEKYREV